MSEDRRRRQYVPLSVHFMIGHTGTELHKRFGNDGILAWIALLAAAKKSFSQGTVTWTSDSDGWEQIGFHEPAMSFTFDGFIRTLGTLHLVRTERRGNLKFTTIAGWEDWNTTLLQSKDAERAKRRRNDAKRPETTKNDQKTWSGRQTDDERNPRLRAQYTPDDAQTIEGTEYEGEYERGKPSSEQVKTVSQSRWPECPHCGRTEWRDRDDHDNHVGYLCAALDPESAERAANENGTGDYSEIIAQHNQAQEVDQ